MGFFLKILDLHFKATERGERFDPWTIMSKQTRKPPDSNKGTVREVFIERMSRALSNGRKKCYEIKWKALFRQRAKFWGLVRRRKWADAGGVREKTLFPKYTSFSCLEREKKMTNSSTISNHFVKHKTIVYRRVLGAFIKGFQASPKENANDIFNGGNFKFKSKYSQ